MQKNKITNRSEILIQMKVIRIIFQLGQKLAKECPLILKTPKGREG